MPAIHRLASTAALLASLSAAACTTDDVEGAPIVTLPTALDLGVGDCGGFATQTFALTNDGDGEFEFSLTSLDPRIAVVPATGTIAPGEARTITVTAAVSTEVAAGERLTAALIARTNAGAPATITVSFAARGAMIELDAPSIGFGEQPVGVRASRGFTVRNRGNVAANVRIASLAGELSVGFAEGTLAAGAARTGEVAYLPDGLGADSAAAAIEIDGAVCGLRPGALVVGGQGVTGEGLLVQGGPVEFGTVTCDGRDATRTLTLVNPTELAGSFRAQMWDADFDDLNFEVTPAQGTVPARGSIEVTVRRRDAAGPGFPRELSSAVRVITALGGVEAIHDVPVHEVLRTAELVVNGDTDLGWVPRNTTVSVPVTITNRGTAAAPLAISTDAPMTTTMPTWIEAGASVTGWVMYTPTTTRYTGALRVHAVGSCQPPVARTYSAGHGAFAVVQPLDVTTIPSVPVTSAALWISNPGDQSLEIRCRPNAPSPLALVFAQTTLDVPAGTSRSFDLTMAAGDGTLGTESAEVLCVAREGLAREFVAHDVIVTRTVIASDAPIPGL